MTIKSKTSIYLKPMHSGLHAIFFLTLCYPLQFRKLPFPLLPHYLNSYSQIVTKFRPIKNSLFRNSGVRRKFPRGGPEFRNDRMTSQINFMKSAKGTTILGWSGDMPRKHFAKLHQKFASLCILKASFSIMPLRNLLEK